MDHEQTSSRRYITPGEARARLGICTTTYHALRKRDPSFPKAVQFGAGTKSLRILESDLERWIAAREAERDKVAA